MKYEYHQRETPYCVAVLNSRIFKSYEWFKTLEAMQVSTLHMVDETFSWYHNCIDEARWLIDKYKPVRLAGSSMGGYAALLLGSLHGIHAKAFGPQTALNVEWDDRWTPEWKKIQETTKYPEYLDLAHLTWAIKPDIYYCYVCQQDIQHARRIKWKVNRYPRDCMRHEDSAKGISGEEIFGIKGTNP